MKMGKVAGATVVAAMIAIGGCASIVSNSKPKVNIYALPQVTTYTIKDSAGKVLLTGQTPGAALLETSRGYFKRESYSITFSADGYSESTQALKPTISGWYWWNILLGGAVGMLIVDPLTGAMYTLPDEVIGTLQPTAASAPSPLSPPVAQVQ